MLVRFEIHTGVLCFGWSTTTSMLDLDWRDQTCLIKTCSVIFQEVLTLYAVDELPMLLRVRMRPTYWKKVYETMFHRDTYWIHRGEER